MLLLWSGPGCDSKEPASSSTDVPGVARGDAGRESAQQVEASLEPLLAFTSRTVELKAAFGEKAMGEVRLVGRLAATARLKVESIDPPGPEVAIMPSEGEKPEGVRVTLTGTRVGTLAGQVSLTTGVARPSTLTLLYSSQVLGNVSVEPTNPLLDLHALGPAGVSVRVTSRRQDFRVDRAWVAEGPFEASLARDDAGLGYVVRVVVRADQVSGDPRGLVGTLRLFSNDPAEPQKDVPLFALGAVNRTTP